MSIYRRGDTWYACYTDEAGKLQRKSLGTKDEREAKQRFSEIEKRLWLIEQGLLDIKSKTGDKTLQDAYTRALRTHYKSPEKAAEAEMRWKVLVRVMEPSTALSSIGRVEAEDARASLLALKVPRGGSTYSEATANRVMSLLGRLLTLAVNWGWLKAAPRMPKVAEHGRERVLTDAEIATMWEALRKSNRPKLINALDLFITLHHEALRMSEAMELEWSQVDLEAGTLTLLKASTKGHKAITKPLTPEVLAILVRRSQADLVRPFADVGDKAMRSAWSYALKAAGLEEQGIVRHTLRHSAATKLIEQGHDVALVKEYLGHRSIQTTMRYIHADHSALQGLAKTLGGCVSSVSVEGAEVAQK